jgi:hypothetical protein
VSPSANYTTIWGSYKAREEEIANAVTLVFCQKREKRKRGQRHLRLEIANRGRGDSLPQFPYFPPCCFCFPFSPLPLFAYRTKIVPPLLFLAPTMKLNCTAPAPASCEGRMKLT